MTVTVACALAVPQVTVAVVVAVTVPAGIGSEPDVPGSTCDWPSAETLHEVAPVLDQLSAVASPDAIVAGENEAETVTAGGGGGGGGSTVTVTATPVDVRQVYVRVTFRAFAASMHAASVAWRDRIDVPPYSAQSPGVTVATVAA